MKKMKKLADKCKYCNQDLDPEKMYLIYQLLVVTNVQCHFIGLEKLMDELNEFIMDKGYHLSASQIVLLRPDIVQEFLKKKYYPEIPIFHILSEHEICYDCYEEWKNLVPER